MNSHTPPHLTQDDLVLHYYGELAVADETAAASHLDACSSCRTEYKTLQRVLGAIDDATVSPVDLAPSFERTVWARLEPDLRRERRGWTSWLLMSPAPLGLAALVVVLVVGAFFAGRAWPPTPSTPEPAATALTADQIRERILLVDLGEHLDRSQMVLVELVSSEDMEPTDLTEGRAQVEQLVADNRLYRQTAEETGNTAVSELLDEIERVLTELAANPDRLSARELSDMRSRIEARDLLFRLRVVSSDVRQRQKESIQHRLTQSS